ncbi:hypothetical protein [Chitinophaga qingshengii]|uniref:Uncharacterized protein n=1 Tax=Chitinophaga qingshengii TaxID=1569794 RepID=A0ABR7TJ07_9BACT|nr:hypothetical protein [Chitinophaga qingshengii]MBC9929501.1 hypothetical protein [Chitinophaga qingshengii]
MMKNFLYLVLCVSMFSCKNSSNFDLSALQLPMADTSFISKHQLEKDMEIGECIQYSSEQPDLLHLYGQSFTGSMGPGGEGDNGFANKVDFFLTKENNKISGYALRTETKKTTEALDKLLNEKLGKTDFHYRNKDFTNQVWYKDGLYYLWNTNSTVAYYSNKTVTGNLTVISEQSPVFLEWSTTGGGFSYYGNYLNEKKKPEHQGKPYSYRNFIDSQKDDAFMGPSYFADYVQ